jgi:hypothetical protein
MQFSKIKEDIKINLDKRIPKDLHEGILCEPLARFLKKKTGISHDEVVDKDPKLEAQGVDVVLKRADGVQVKVQVTHCRDHDMRPYPKIKNINTTGEPIKMSAKEKCDKYCQGLVDTRDIILLIDGATIGSFIQDLMTDESFLKFFRKIPCFKEIYYMHCYDRGEIFPLKTGTVIA